MAKKNAAGMSPEGDETGRGMAQHWSAIFGAEVRSRRVKLGIASQRALAERMGYKTHATITQIEMGNVMANFDVAMELARFLGIDLNAVMGVAAPPPPSQEWYSDMFMLRLPAKVHELWSHTAQQEILTRTVEEMGRAMRETMGRPPGPPVDG